MTTTYRLTLIDDEGRDLPAWRDLRLNLPEDPTAQDCVAALSEHMDTADLHILGDDQSGDTIWLGTDEPTLRARVRLERLTRRIRVSRWGRDGYVEAHRANHPETGIHWLIDDHEMNRAVQLCRAADVNALSVEGGRIVRWGWRNGYEFIPAPSVSATTRRGIASGDARTFVAPAPVP